MTSDTTVVALRQPEEAEDPLTAVLRSGARRLLAQAVEAEAEAFLATMKCVRRRESRPLERRRRLQLAAGIALDHLFAWSLWRRIHQAVAKACHWRRRLREVAQETQL